MSRELSDVLIILAAIGIPTLAVLIAILLPKYHRSQARLALENRALREESRMLKSEMTAVGGRVAEVERIVTDESHRLGEEIDALRPRADRTLKKETRNA